MLVPTRRTPHHRVDISHRLDMIASFRPLCRTPYSDHGSAWLLTSRLRPADSACWAEAKGLGKASGKRLPGFRIDQTRWTFALENLHKLFRVPLRHGLA